MYFPPPFSLLIPAAISGVQLLSSRLDRLLTVVSSSDDREFIIYPVSSLLAIPSATTRVPLGPAGCVLPSVAADYSLSLLFFIPLELQASPRSINIRAFFSFVHHASRSTTRSHDSTQSASESPVMTVGAICALPVEIISMICKEVPNVPPPEAFHG